jgi:hypothetical protein
MANQPRTSSRASRQAAKDSSIATARTRQRDNNEKSGEPQQYSPNMPLGIHTGDGLPHDHIVEQGVKYYVQDCAQTVVDKSSRVPAWKASPLPATHGAAHEGGGYRKEPTRRVYTEADCHQISSGGVVDHSSKLPSYSDANRY